MPGKVVNIAEPQSGYDSATEELRQRFEADACIVIVLGGNEGTGVSMKMPEDLRPHIPSLFRNIAQEWEDALIMEQGALLCPVCRTGLSFHPRHPLNGNNKPRRGSLTVCAECASFLKLDDAWRIMTEEELADLPDEVRNALIRTRRSIEHGKH